MSYEHLQQHDLFLPKEHWGQVDLGSSTNPWVVLVAACLAATSVVLMVVGAGAALTWLGAGLFVIFLYGYAVLSNRAVDAQNRQIESLVEESTRGSAVTTACGAGGRSGGVPSARNGGRRSRRSPPRR